MGAREGDEVISLSEHEVTGMNDSTVKDVCILGGDLDEHRIQQVALV